MPAVWLDVVTLWRIREPVSALSHLLGALLGIVATLVLVRRARRHGLSGRAVARLAAYGLSLVIAFAASTLFHFPDWPAERLVPLKKIDHAAIFLFIAGTCTVIYGARRVRWTRWMIRSTWAAALGALVMKVLIWPMALWLTAFIYVSIGLLGLAGLLVLGGTLHDAPWLLLGGGGGVLILGAVVFAVEWPVLWPGVIEGHEVFHLLVLVGAGLHFGFVYRYCTGPPLKALASDGND